MHFNAIDFPLSCLGSHFDSFYLGCPADIVRVCLCNKVFTTSAVGPLAEVTPAAFNARVVKHAGHAGLLVSLHPPCELHVRIYKPRIVISIVMSQPFHAISESSFVAAFRNDIQQVIGGDKHIETASE